MKRHLLARLATFALFASACPLFGQPIELLGDLRPGADPFVSGAAQVFGTANGKALLTGSELGAYSVWASDGTVAGTVPIVDLSSSDRFPVVFTASPQRSFILELDSGSDNRVLRTDGTRPGTFAVRDENGSPIRPGWPTVAGAATLAGGFFVYACTSDGCGIWYTDGTAPTARKLADFIAYGDLFLQAIGDAVYWLRDGNVFTSRPDDPGERLVFGSAGDSIRGFTVANGRLYFAAASSAGEEAWSSDGTAAGTVRLTAFVNPTPFTPQAAFRAAGGRVYFVADDGEHGQELWSTDGSPSGTRRETDFAYGRPFDYFEPFDDGTGPAVIGGRLLFAAADSFDHRQLWSKTGSAAPVPLLDPCGPGCAPLGDTGRMLAAGGRVYFLATDSSHGYEVWSSDGTKAGTRMLVDACPGSCDSVPYTLQFRQFVQAGSRVFFWTPYDLWVTDGTPAGTLSVHHDETYQFGPYDVTRPVVALGDRYLFAARDPTYRYEVLVTGGTPGSTDVLTDLASDADSSRPKLFTALGARVVFSAISDDPQGNTLWATDGTPGGTLELTNAHLTVCDGAGTPCYPLRAAGGLAYFVQRDDGHVQQLWRTDGTLAGTVELTSGPSAFSFAALGVGVGNTFYFPRRNVDLALELWSSDGTPAGTHALFVLPSVFDVSSLRAVGNEIYFIGSDATGTNAWRTDGTLAGTRKLTSTGHGDSFRSFVRAGNAVWFATTPPAAGELWRSDGTAAGTQLIANPAGIFDLVSFQGRAYFLAQSQANPSQRALWRVNPQENGIEQVALFPEADIFDVSGLTEYQGALYFVARTAAEGIELWRSDGTAAGTRLVRDINPGPDSSRIGQLTATPQGVFFAADDSVHGLELWKSDGTADGTQLVHDLWPGPVGSNPSAGAVVGNHLVFAATDEAFGTEPRSLDLQATRSCVASDAALCLDGARYRVTATWKDFQGNRGVGRAVALTADTGYFWFFGPQNVETVIKVLDGHGVNGHDWVFYGALSSVEYTLTVTDTHTGAVRRYFNPSGRLASVGDTQGFGPLGAYARTPPPAAAPPPAARRIASGDTSPCVASSTRLCLNGGRFEVQAAWKDFSGNTGVGHAVSLTGDTGYLWFFSDTNVEVVIKVLDGTPLNGKFWLFYGALSSVEYTLTVRDTVTGAVRVYHNVSGHMASVADTSAF